MGKLLENRKLLIIVVVALLGGAFAAKTFLLQAPPVDEKRLAKEKGPIYEIGEPFVVNLAGGGESPHFAKAGVALRLSALSASKLPSGAHGGTEPAQIEEEPAIRDIVRSILESRTSEELSSRKEKDALKKEIVAAVNEETELKILDVYFTEFAVQ